MYQKIIVKEDAQPGAIFVPEKSSKQQFVLQETHVPDLNGQSPLTDGQSPWPDQQSPPGIWHFPLNFAAVTIFSEINSR